MVRRRFSPKFKLEVLQLVLERGVSARQAPVDLTLQRTCCAGFSGASRPPCPGVPGSGVDASR